jgi:opacity protein-like surface antigen
MRKRTGLVVAVLGWTLTLSSAMGQTSTAAETTSPQDLSRSGAYLGVGPAYVVSDFNLPGRVSADNGVGLDARGGYRLLPNLAAELDLQYATRFDIHQGQNHSKVGTVDTLVVTANAKGYPLSGWQLSCSGGLCVLAKERVQPYGVVGIGLLRSSETDTPGVSIAGGETVFASRFGGGVDVYVTANVVLNVEGTYVLAAHGGRDVTPIVFALQYRF